MCTKRFKLCVLLIFLEEPNQQLPFVTRDIDSDDDLRPMPSEPLIHDDIRDQGRSQGGARGGGRPPNRSTIRFFKTLKSV